MQYILITLVLFSLELVYFKIADKYNIIDKPNHRSSHSKITLRGGGIIFPIALVIAFLLGFVGWMNYAFNFMDGINGITVLYALIAIASFSVLPIHASSLPLLITMGLSCFGLWIF